MQSEQEETNPEMEQDQPEEEINNTEQPEEEEEIVTEAEGETFGQESENSPSQGPEQDIPSNEPSLTALPSNSIGSEPSQESRSERVDAEASADKEPRDQLENIGVENSNSYSVMNVPLAEKPSNTPLPTETVHDSDEESDPEGISNNTNNLLKIIRSSI